MKKILLLLLIACCIFSANAQIVSVAQSNRWETIHWYFELDSEKGTAILIAPPSGSYSFLNPGTEYLTDGVSNFFWTPSITGMTDEGNYFTAVKIPPAITGTDGKVYPVKAIAPRALAGSNVAFIHVPSSVVEIGEEAFEGCSSLVGIDRMSAYELVPESVAKLGKGVFKNCTALRRIDIGDGVETIEPETFDGCDALKHIKFGKKVKEIKCKLPSLEGAAFHSTVPPAMDYQLTAAEVWAPADCKGAYAAVFDDVKSFEVRTDQEQTLHFYTGYSRPVSFAIESAPVSGNGLDNSFFLYRAMSYGGLIPQYSEIASVLADVDLHTSVRKPLPYAAYFSDTEVAVVHGPSVFPSSDASNLQLRYTVPGDYELTIVSNDFTRASYKWKVEVRDGNPVTRMLISAPLFLAVGDKAECKLTFNEGKSTPDNTAVSWASENEGIVRVDENGVLTAVGEGTAKIIARSGDPACKEVFTTHQVSVSLSGVIPVNIPQMVALSNSITSWSQLKTEEITTEFHLAEISGADNQGIITAPSVDLNESGTAPRTPYTFPYPGKESLTVGGVKMMSSSIIDDIILIDLTGEYEARRTPLIIPGGANVIWDASVRFLDFVKIGDYAFAGSNIRYAHVSDSYVHGESKITELGDYVFAECHSFKGLPDGSAYDVVPDRITKMGRGVFKNCDNMEIMAIGDGITELPEETFDGCTSLRQVRLGAGIRAIKCSVDAKEVIVIASAVVPQLAPDCTLSAPVILVPAEHIEKYRAAWGWDNIKPYGITVEGGRSKLGAYYNRPRNLKIDVNGYKTDGTCDYAYPYLIGKSDSPSYATGSERPFYRVEFDGSIASVFVPEKTGAKITFGLAAGTRTMTLVSTDITRARVDVPMSFAIGTPVSGVTINETSVSTPMTVGEERSMVAAVSPSSASVKTVEWSVSDPEIAVMDSKTGKLKALKKGFVTVTATSTDARSDIFSASATVEVRGPVTDMSLLLKTDSGDKLLSDDETISCYSGDNFSFGTLIKPSADSECEIEWTIDAQSDTIAVFDEETLMLTALGVGTCTLKATLSGDNTYSGEDIVRVVNFDITSPAVDPEPSPEPSPEPQPEPQPEPDPEPDPVVPTDPVDPSEPDPQPEPDDPESDIDPEEPENPDPDDSSEIKAVESDRVKIYVSGLSVTVSGVKTTSEISLYALDGRLVARVKAQENTVTVQAPRPGIYILLAGTPHKLSLH